MKKYTAILLLLIVSGVVLAYFTVKQSLDLNEEVYLETSESIRHLKVLDDSISFLLFKIRYEGSKNYATLEELGINLSDEFDNLRYEALFEELESSDVLNDASESFGEALLTRQDNVDRFVESHRKLISLEKDFKRYATIDSSFYNTVKDLSISEAISKANINFYLFLQKNNSSNKSKVDSNIASINSMLGDLNQNDKDVVVTYTQALSDFIIAIEEVGKFFSLSVNKETTERLNILESSYANFHNLEIDKANSFRNFLIAYGFVLLVLVLIFTYKLRSQYLSLEKQVADRTEEIAQAYHDLKESQEQLIQSEKMASLGEMVAGVAHEINTPLGYVNSNVETVSENIKDITPLVDGLGSIYKEAVLPKQDNKKISALLSTTLKDYRRLKTDGVFEENEDLLSDSRHGLDEISHLVKSLKDFSRLDRQSTDKVNVHDCLESSIKIASNHIRENNVDIKRVFGDLPDIVCIPSKLNQLFLNIITNAAQAMKDDGGCLTIETQVQQGYAVIKFIDEGIGMDEKTMQKMFDPFFTSKPIGEGTGLGMSIAYKIVQAHQGKIEVQSELNQGTAITIELPLNLSDV